MTYQDLLDKLKTYDEEQLDQDVEISGDCITDSYYDIDVRLDPDDNYSIQINLT